MSGFTTPHACPGSAVTTSIGRVDPLERFGLPNAYFQTRQGELLAGYGVAARVRAEDAEGLSSVFAALTTGPSRIEGPPPPAWWLGGVAFDAESPRDRAWSAFGAAHWIVPQHLVWSRGGALFLTTFGDAPSLEASREAATERPLRVSASADPDAWRASVRAAQGWLEEGQGTKVVLARPIDLAGDGPFDVKGALRRLCERYRGCTVFMLRAEDGSTFLGATPETLLKRHGNRVQTEALAGTALAGEEGGLLASEHIGREHRAVIDGIREAVAGISCELEIDQHPAVVSIRQLRHLRTGITFQTRREAPFETLVRALHPTPAVGGTPRLGAMAFIRAHEGMDRGFYAGPVGWVGREHAELSVALRSAWVQGDSARIFVGAGLVAGCDPETEWSETEAKSRPMVEALVEVGS